MKPGKTWLRAALCAQEMNKLQQQQRALEAWRSLLAAAESEQQAVCRVAELAAAWEARRGAACLDAAMESLYRHFHTHLREEADLAGKTSLASRDAWEVAAAELGRVHSLQRLLERMAERVAAEQRQQASAGEVRASAEAWLFGRIARAADEPLQPGEGHAPRSR